MDLSRSDAGLGGEAHAGVPLLQQQRRAAVAKQVCRFHGTKNGCRAGDACPYLHDPSLSAVPVPRGKATPVTSQRREPSGGSSLPASGAANIDTREREASATAEEPYRQYMPPPVDRTKIVQKPISRAQVENPREFQAQQLRRRFSPNETLEMDGTAFTFNMAPSDPDFPFEMVGLECILHVPSDYPISGRPTLDVRNKEMGRGYQINVERGFDALVAKSPQLTLLGLMSALDKQLESLLTGQKADTIKIMPNNRSASSEQTTGIVRPDSSQIQVGKTALVTKSPTSFTNEQKTSAGARRESEVRQLEARLGRLPLFSKSSDGIIYTLPIEPRKRVDLPVPLQVVETIKLSVPLLYPLQPCKVEILGVGRAAARNTEMGFGKRVRESAESSLMGLVNYLTQNMHILATESVEDDVPETLDGVEIASLRVKDSQIPTAVTKQTDLLDDRGHIHIIPRPPEWTMVGVDEEEEDDGSDPYDSGDESSDEGSGVEVKDEVEVPRAAPERGVLLSFPYLELHGIELLEVSMLCVTIKCERCKDQMDIKNLRDTVGPTSGTATGTRMESCKKCANSLTIGFRRELMHVNSVRAGYLDLDGCTVVDMLPSNFVPTCSECSTTYPLPGLVSVRGESTMTVCRECHHKMSFKIPELKFLLVSSTGVIRNDQLLPKKKVRENLGIVAGQELPRRGRCNHYGKSYRWFRFGCCSKVFACDKCHDDQTDHPNEHANRMICGFCSREQNYRPEDCGICHAVLVGKKGSGFWEGGKGTRDKTRMSRKDPRKYKRRPAAKSNV